MNTTPTEDQYSSSIEQFSDAAGNLPETGFQVFDMALLAILLFIVAGMLLYVAGRDPVQ